MKEAIEELADFEKKLPQLTFTQERSNLTALNVDFSPFDGKDFLGWLDFFLKEKRK